MDNQDQEKTPSAAAVEEATGLRFIVLSMDKDLELSLENCDVPAWCLSGVADWLALMAESMMCEELGGTEEEE